MTINQLTSGTDARQRRTSWVEHRKTVLRRHGALYEAKLRVLLKWFYAHYVCVGDANRRAEFPPLQEVFGAETCRILQQSPSSDLRKKTLNASRSS